MGVSSNPPELVGREDADSVPTNAQPNVSHLWCADVAQHLAALDAQQADWDQRVLCYADARSRIQQYPHLSQA